MIFLQVLGLEGDLVCARSYPPIVSRSPTPEFVCSVVQCPSGDSDILRLLENKSKSYISKLEMHRKQLQKALAMSSNAKNLKLLQKLTDQCAVRLSISPP